jgi:hypothetical protein
MSYATINSCARDSAFMGRVNACVAQEHRWDLANVYETMYTGASATDIEAAYAYALNSGNPNPGGDETVVTDGMILSAVQASWPP